MTREKNASIAENLKDWLQIIAIILAGVWAIYTFLHKEIIRNSDLTTHLSVQVNLEKKGYSMLHDTKYNAVHLNVKLTNLSDKKIYIVGSNIVVYGYKYDTNNAHLQLNEEQIVTIINNRIRKKKDLTLNIKTASFPMTTDIILVGKIFTDWELQPKEVASQRLVTLSPLNAYDFIEAVATFPATTIKEHVGSIDIDWSYKNLSEAPTWEYTTSLDEIVQSTFNKSTNHEQSLFSQLISMFKSETSNQDNNPEVEINFSSLGLVVFEGKNMVSMWDKAD